MKKITTLALLLFLAASAGVSAQNEPTVTTNARHARGATMAFGRAIFKSNNGNSITERGYCWSSIHREPTLADSSSTETLSNNGLIFCMKNLQPATMYFARPYAKAADGSIGYGQTIKIVTLPQGTITWNYDNGGSTDENTRINSAVKSCVSYWNDLTSISGLTLSVHYGASTATADCSYGGWMRVGPNSSYQRTGTIMHEALHAIGVGTCDLWYSSSSPMRSGSGTGQWLGDRATDLVRFWDNTQTSIINGDTQHLWPYGINGAQEDTGTDVLYIGNSLIAQAVCEDGLPPTSGHPAGLPYYSFDQEDTTRYFIKNENETYGLLTSYLTMADNGTLTWKELTATEAIASDQAGWYVTFNPSTQLYQIKNASTQKYITINSQSGLQLMRSRTEVTNASGTVVSSQRGYWLVQGGTSNCLNAAANGATSFATLNLADASTRQRWLILTRQQAADMENSGLIVARDDFSKVRAKIQAVLDSALLEVTEGARESFETELETLTEAVNATSSASDVTNAQTQMLSDFKTFLGEVCTANIAQPFDITFLMTNPDFATDKSGWSGYISSAGTWSNQLVEFYQTKASAVQILKDMPQGTYELKCKAFQRPGSYTTVYTNYVAGKDNVGGKLYLNSADDGVLLKNIMADRSSTKLHSDDKQVSDGAYIPNTMASAKVYFDKGLYDNVTQYYLTTPGQLKLGLVATDNGSSSYWTIFADFRLYYYGPKMLTEIQDFITDLSEICRQEKTTDVICNLAGQRVSQTSRGLYIVNHKKILVK